MGLLLLDMFKGIAMSDTCPNCGSAVDGGKLTAEAVTQCGECAARDADETKQFIEQGIKLLADSIERGEAKGAAK